LEQATFFLALSVAGRLGTASLAAHQVVAQLWLLTFYLVDGFAVAGTVLGSRLVGKANESALRCGIGFLTTDEAWVLACCLMQILVTRESCFEGRL
jgi:Na+-driven multidrug efflux pump